MSAYVELFRNVPGADLDPDHHSRSEFRCCRSPAFRGDDPEASMWLDAVALTERGIYVPKPIWGDGSIVVVACSSVDLRDLLLPTLRQEAAVRHRSSLLPMGWPSVAIFIVPTLLMYFIMGRPDHVGIPRTRWLQLFRWHLQVRGSLIALWFALSIYTGAFIAENVRAGILAVSKGRPKRRLRSASGRGAS